ncbi:CPBP family glutamic-type intramembrane protease [Spirosoma panaciterrae]|uniref:CPBP family glutamic-type intramembrane protease n=1 Tax=Spirosoma panaciterrae TaxID=496058 RepID=UPI003CCC04A1
MTIKGPIVEELSFRLLLRPTRINLLVSSIFSFLLFTELVFGYGTLINYFIRVVTAIIFSLCVLHYQSTIIYYLSHHKKNSLIVSSVLFGFTHILNFYPIQLSILFIYPIYVLPQICMGFILGAIRLRNSIASSIALHILINGSVVWYKLL